MAEETGIKWTWLPRPDGREGTPGKTFNAWIGCEKVSAGCAFCYAEELDDRFFSKKPGEDSHWGPNASRMVLSDGYWSKPRNWNAEAKRNGFATGVFCSSLADVFDEKAPPGQRDRLWATIRSTPWLAWMLLTKRIENAAGMLPKDWGSGYPNAWIGVTAEDQAAADKRIPVLAGVPAVVRFLSIEPMIGPVDISKFASGSFDWAIWGGESGASARTFDPEWVRPSLEWAGSAGIKRFVKQMGSKWAASNGSMDSKAGIMGEWPEWLRTREYPRAIVPAS